MKRLMLMAFSAILISSCGGPTEPAAEEQSAGEESQQTEQETPKAEEPAGPVTLNLKAIGETMTEMAYEPTRLEAPAGAEVTLILENTATSEAMIHNVVIIQFGKQTEITQDALEVGPDNDYIPESEFIIAHTTLAQPGETVQVTFTAPEEAGNYQYICTYPGHTAMKGTLIVK